LNIILDLVGYSIIYKKRSVNTERYCPLSYTSGKRFC